MKLNLLLTLCALFGMGAAWGQSFAPVGAEWHYGTSGGYILLTAEKDTVVDNVDCVKLSVEKFYKDTTTGDTASYSYPPEFITQINDSVMYYVDGEFRKMMDFGAEIGDQITIYGRSDMCPESHGTLNVVDKGVENVGGVDLRYVIVKSEVDSFWGYGDYTVGSLSQTTPEVKITERLGTIGHYLFPSQHYVVCDDGMLHGTLRCYQDDELGQQTLSDEECKHIGSNDNVKELDTHNISVYPNPFEEKVFIMSSTDSRLDIYNRLSQKIKSVDIKEGSQEISLSELVSGVYFLVFNNGKSVSPYKILKK